MGMIDPFALEIRRDPLPIYSRLRDADPAHHIEKYDARTLSRFTCLARMQGRVALGVLPERMPTYQVDLSGAGRHETEFVLGFSRLPLRFGT